MLTDKVIEAREQLVDLEEQMRDAEEYARLTLEPSITEAQLRNRMDAVEKDILDHKASEARGVRWNVVQMQVAASQKRLQQLRDELEKARAERLHAWKVKRQAVSVLRKKMVRVEETIRQLERQRDGLWKGVERRQDKVAERLRQPEGGSGGMDRSLRALQRSLGTIERDLADVRREVRRLREDRKK
jgi:hypothetical protein